MKKFFLLITALFPTILSGKGEVSYTHLQSLYSNAGAVVINKVVLSDTATVMYCTAKGKINSWFQFAPSTYLSDEKDVRYHVKGAVGVALGEKSFIPKAGQMDFRLLFEPMPKDTKIFDLIEGSEKDMFRIYGIHDAKSKVKIPEGKDKIDAEETSEKMFRKGKAMVRGTIEGYSQDWKTGIMFFDISHLGQAETAPYPMNRPCTALNADGTFCTELSLDHPVWAEMSMGGTNTSIPFYVRPGDTLDITVKGMPGNDITVDYVSNNPKGSCDKLLKHHNLPLISYDWNRLTDYGRNLDNKNFMDKVYASVDDNMRLCDYVAWKYKLSPWETHLLKTRQKFELTERYLFMASKLFKEKVEYPGREQAQKEDFIGYDYSPYKVLNILPLDDPSLSFLPYSLGFPPSLDLTYIMAFIDSYAFFDNVSKTGPFDYVKVEMEKDSLQVEALRELTATKGNPWAIQAFLTRKITRLQGEWNDEQRKRLVDFLSSSYLTYPYFKEKVKELERLSSVSSTSLAYEMPEEKNSNEIKSVLDRYKGRYVHVVWLSDPDEDISFYANPSVKNIMSDNKSLSDLQIIAIVNGDAYSDKNELARMRKELSASVVHIVGRESFLKMQALFHFYGSGKQITFDRNGLVLRQSLDMKYETTFREWYRNILKAEKNSIFNNIL